MLRVGFPIYVEGKLDQGAKALLAGAQVFLGPLALGDIAHQGQIPASVLLETADADLHREGGPVLAPVNGLERDRLPGDDALPQVPDGGLVETGVEIPSMFADQFLPAVAEILAGLVVDVQNDRIVVKSERTRRSRDPRRYGSAPRSHAALAPLASTL